MSKLTDAQIHEAITAGKKTEIGNMPALGKRLKPEEITDIVNYVRTLGEVELRARDQGLRQDKGRQSFWRPLSCHALQSLPVPNPIA